jgi:hypothetical protein
MNDGIELKSYSNFITFWLKKWSGKNEVRTRMKIKHNFILMEERKIKLNNEWKWYLVFK